MANGRQGMRPAVNDAAPALEPDEVMPASAGGMLEQQTRGEIDIQIVTARRFPRSIKTFQEQALSMATIDEETAASCFYTLPKRKGSDKPIEGPSVRLAEIVSSAWGHLRIVGRIVEEGDRFLTAYGGAWDLQTNVARAVEVRRRITNRDGGRYNDDMIATTANAAIAIATRNALFQVIPQSYTRQIYLKCREVAVGKAETLGAKRAKMIEYFQKMGIEPARVFALLELRGVEDITLDHLATLKGLATAIKDGDTTIEDAFPPAGTVPQSDPLVDEMKALGDVATKATEYFDALKMNRAQRLVQLRAFKGHPDKLLEILGGMLEAQKADPDAPAPPQGTRPDVGQAPASPVAEVPAATSSTTPAPRPPAGGPSKFSF
jgi:hypothetical protein